MLNSATPPLKGVAPAVRKYQNRIEHRIDHVPAFVLLALKDQPPILSAVFPFADG